MAECGAARRKRELEPARATKPNARLEDLLSLREAMIRQYRTVGALAALGFVFLGACRHGNDEHTPGAAPRADLARGAPPALAGTASTQGTSRPATQSDAGVSNTEERSGNTTAASDDGRLRISGLTSRVRHIHGGPPAWIGEAKFEVENKSRASRNISITRVVFVKRHPCSDAASDVRTELKAAGIAVERKNRFEATQPRATLAAGERAVLFVGFPRVEAYQSFCDYFSFEVTFELEDAQRLTAVATTEVTRVTPLRR